MFKDETGFDEKDDDALFPDEEGQKEVTEPVVRIVVETLPEKKETAVKKSGAATKKRKAAAPPVSEEEKKQQKIDMSEIYLNGMLSKQTMPRLKQFLKSQGLAVGGKKSELVERVQGLYPDVKEM